MSASIKYTVTAALDEIMADKFRGPGCATIVMTDGREYYAVDRYSSLVMQLDHDGQLIERIESEAVGGEVEHIRWSCDELGGVYI